MKYENQNGKETFVFQEPCVLSIEQNNEYI